MFEIIIMSMDIFCQFLSNLNRWKRRHKTFLRRRKKTGTNRWNNKICLANLMTKKWILIVAYLNESKKENL